MLIIYNDNSVTDHVLFDSILKDRAVMIGKSMKMFGDARDWFFKKRFGLFVHWGLYSLNAWHEQEQARRMIPRSEYSKLINDFNPERFDPDAWLDLADKTGMRYICFTVKHHDGFCMWNTKYSEFNVMNSPYGRDILAELADACHRRNFPLCLYYSVVDWHHENYPNRNKSHELVAPEPGDQPSLEKYVAFLNSQIRELCENYGQIHGIWWDMNQTSFEDESINDMIHQLQPAAVINNRGFSKGDFETPERDWDESLDSSLAFTEPTEACNSIGAESWGYRENEDYFTSEYLIREIDKVLAKGGNYLLNVGPKADGTIGKEAVMILDDIGRWMESARESFDDVVPVNELTENRNVLLTRRDKTIYVHLNSRPNTKGVVLKPIVALPTKATLLSTGQEVEFVVKQFPNSFKEQIKQLHLCNLPIDKHSNEVMIVKMNFN